jgi:hypothetical protein
MEGWKDEGMEAAGRREVGRGRRIGRMKREI